MELSLTAAALLGLLLAGWTFAAAALVLGARNRARQARSARAAGQRLGKMIAHSPAIPLLVKGDGALEGPERLAAWLGLVHLPGFLSELRAEEGGLTEQDLAKLREAVRRTQRTAAPFRMHVTLRGSNRSLSLWGQCTDPSVGPHGSALVWWFDFTEAHNELSRTRNEAEGAFRDFSAISGLIEAAPMPMWVRGPNLRLRLVNAAYVDAVGAPNSATVLGEQIELVEAFEGRTAGEVAGRARESGAPIERLVQATIGGQRRPLRVRDLPLGEGDVAGFAIDVEDQEAQARALSALQAAQRAMLDLLSAGVAHFAYDRSLAFANQPFRRIFALPPAERGETTDFRGFFDRAREKGRLPETGDFRAWRHDVSAWFGSEQAIEQAWSLADGTYLRVIGVPMPDGGLVLIAEDRSEQLAFSATRDTAMRTRAAILDCVPEALAIFAPDGRLQSWNRQFSEHWGLPADYLDGRPRAEDVLARIGRHLQPEGSSDALHEIVRAATLDRERRSARTSLADGRTVEFTGSPLPDGNGLLVSRSVDGSNHAFAAPTRDEERSDRASRAHDTVPAEEARATAVESGVSIEDLSLDLEKVELLAFVIDIVREREAAIEAKYITLNLRGDKRSGSVQADRQLLARALGNLVDRIIAASPAGGRIEMELLPRRDKARLVLSADAFLADGGDAGAAVDGAAMADARRLVTAHGGALELETDPQGSTRVTITLP